MSPGPFRRPLPRPCSPPPPPPPPYVPCACATTTETDERPETSEIVEQLLDEFTERIQSFFLALMGFNHPHMERLQAALDQQVKALGRGLMRAMAVKDAFWGLKSAVAESQLWKRLKQCRQRLFDCQKQVQQYAATAAEEASMRQETIEASALVRQQAERARAMATKQLCRGPEAPMGVCFYHWGKLTKTRLSRGLMVQQVHGRNLHAVRACLMQSTFLRWRQASSDAVRERAFGAQHNAAAVAVAAQAQRSKAALHSVVNAAAKQTLPTIWKSLGAWQLLTLRSHRRRWKERAAAAELAVHQEDALRQRLLQALNRRCCEGNQHNILKAALARWMAGAALSAALRRSREGAQKAANWSVSVLRRRQTKCTAWRCLTSWSVYSKIRQLQESLTRLSVPAAQTPRRPASASDRCYFSHVAGSEAAADCHRLSGSPPRSTEAFPRIIRQYGQESGRQTLAAAAALLGQSKGPDPILTSWEVKQHLHAAADAVFQQLGSAGSSATRQASPEALKHWSLANEASMSEEGYQKLREFHREQARERRKHSR